MINIILVLETIYAYRQCTRNCANKIIIKIKQNGWIQGIHLGWLGTRMHCCIYEISTSPVQVIFKGWAKVG